MSRLARAEYEPFKSLRHLFLVGDLQRRNPHPFVRDSRLELILCFYNPGDDGRPHWHPEVTEYEFVLEGEIGYLNTATGETEWFTAGDLRCLPAGICVKRMVRRATRTLAIKVPSNAEKIHCAECSRACARRVTPCLQEAACELQ